MKGRIYWHIHGLACDSKRDDRKCTYCECRKGSGDYNFSPTETDAENAESIRFTIPEVQTVGVIGITMIPEFRTIMAVMFLAVVVTGRTAILRKFKNQMFGNRNDYLSLCAHMRDLGISAKLHRSIGRQERDT